MKLKIIFCLFSISFLSVHCQYRRRHADVTKELIRLLSPPDTGVYYFSLLPPELSAVVCKQSSLHVEDELAKAIFRGDKKRALF